MQLPQVLQKLVVFFKTGDNSCGFIIWYSADR